MPRYYFDLREGDDLAEDEEGMELRDLEAVHEEAARSLADIARDEVRRVAKNGGGHEMSIEVRDEAGPVLQITLIFAVNRLKH